MTQTIVHYGHVLLTFLCLGFVIVIHEYGHLLVAKFFRVCALSALP